MQTNFIELLLATAPEGLEQTAATLCGEVKKLLKARTPKRYLALEPYARNTNLCHHLLDLLTGQPALPEAYGMPPAADAARPVGRHGSAEPAAARTGGAVAESLPHAGDALPVRRAVPDPHPPSPA